MWVASRSGCMRRYPKASSSLFRVSATWSITSRPMRSSKPLIVRRIWRTHPLRPSRLRPVVLLRRSGQRPPEDNDLATGQRQQLDDNDPAGPAGRVFAGLLGTATCTGDGLIIERNLFGKAAHVGSANAAQQKRMRRRNLQLKSSLLRVVTSYSGAFSAFSKLNTLLRHYHLPMSRARRPQNITKPRCSREAAVRCLLTLFSGDLNDDHPTTDSDEPGQGERAVCQARRDLRQCRQNTRATVRGTQGGA